ncbi:transporter substrate-binding domain-containing protein [Actinomycetes bacterium NPDC127524]
MSIKRRLGLLLSIILLAGALAACGTSGNKDGANSSGGKTLTMATSADYRPFEYVETSTGDEIKGFDVDLAKLIAKKLGYTITVKDMDFNGLVPALQNKQADFVMAGMTPTPDRKKSVDFSDVYYTANHMIVAKKDSNIKTPQDLKGKTVGVQLASIQEGIASDLVKKEKISLKIEKRNRIPELVEEIKAGRFDAAIIEDTVAKGYLKGNKDLTGNVIKTAQNGAGSAIAFQKGSKLTDKFNKELKKLQDDGEVKKLVIKWFGDQASK